MHSDAEKTKKGFSALSDLASTGVAARATSDTGMPRPNATLPSPVEKVASGVEATTQDLGSPQPVDADSLGRGARHSQRNWLIGVVGVVCLVWLATYDKTEETDASINSLAPKTQTPTRPTKLNTLSRDIENGKVRAKQIEGRLGDMDDSLGVLQRRMQLLKASGKIDDYNRLVPSYNALIQRRGNLYDGYSRLIDDINGKVARYNSGQR